VLVFKKYIRISFGKSNSQKEKKLYEDELRAKRVN
jgi:ribosomal protein S24E